MEPCSWPSSLQVPASQSAAPAEEWCNEGSPVSSPRNRLVGGLMNIHLFQPTALHELFLEIAQHINHRCALVDRLEEADVVVIDSPGLIDLVYGEEVIVVVLYEKDT